jgi:AmmeMemoRadiSam system protein B
MCPVADIRPSPIVGTWYQSDPERLRRQVKGYLDAARLPELPGNVIAVIAPHAGHRYSGKTAGHAFAAVRGRTPALVALVSPMHQPYPGSVLTTAHRAYATPLGTQWVDEDALASLEEELLATGMDLARLANDREHSLEIELPFLQVALAGEFKILPLMLRSQSPLTSLNLGKALAKVLKGRDVLLVATTDLSHFYPENLARELDGEMLRRLRGFSPDELFAAERTGKGFACGVSAVAAVLWTARDLGADCVEILHYSTSAEETGDRASVVGYGAAAVLQIA